MKEPREMLATLQIGRAFKEGDVYGYPRAVLPAVRSRARRVFNHQNGFYKKRLPG